MWLIVPIQVIHKGVVVTVCLTSNHGFWLYFFYLFLLIESYAVFSTLLTYIVLTILYIRPTSTSKILVAAQLFYIPIVLITFYKYSLNTKEWSSFPPELRSSIIYKASVQLNLPLEDYFVFAKITKSNTTFYVIEVVFSTISTAAYIASFIIYILLQKFLPYEKVLHAKLMFSKELRIATKASIIVILLGLAAPRTILNVCLLLCPSLSTIMTIPVFLGECLAPLVIPIIFLSGFYAPYFTRLFFRFIPFLKSSISPVTDEILVAPSSTL